MVFYILALKNQMPVTNTTAIQYLHFLLALTVTSLQDQFPKINVIKINIYFHCSCSRIFTFLIVSKKLFRLLLFSQ